MYYVLRNMEYIQIWNRKIDFKGLKFFTIEIGKSIIMYGQREE